LKNRRSKKNSKTPNPPKFDVAPNAYFIFTIVIFAFAYVTSSFVYFGLIWGAGDISGSLHLNSAINGIMALVGSQLICKKS